MKAKINVNKSINCSIKQNKSISGIINNSVALNAAVDNGESISAGSTQRGAQGIPGEAATIQLGTVSTGAAGTDVIITNSGDEHAAIFNFTIPRGDKGEQGEQGEQGVDGYSPIATVTQTSSGATISITDINGTTTANITNGADGTGSVNDVLVNGTSVLDGDIAKVIVPTDNLQLTNGAGYIAGITSGDVTTALGYTPYNATNPNGYITGITSGDVTTALGYTPYNSSNPNGYTSNIGTVTSVNGNTPDGTGAVTVTIPTVNDATLTITQDSVSIGTFTANASSNVTIDIDLSGKADVDLTNINDTAKIAIAHNSMPSDTYDTLTLGASGTTYTMPSDGYLQLAMTSSPTATGDINIYVNGVWAHSAAAPPYYTSSCNIPVKKNDVLTIGYSAPTLQYFRFVYAVGSESEAS